MAASGLLKISPFPETITQTNMKRPLRVGLFGIGHIADKIDKL